jgi:hypothetical protein
MAWACLPPGLLLTLFLPANIAHQFVGISVGIGCDRQRKLFGIQMVI